MAVLERLSSSILPASIRKRHDLQDDEEVYVKIVKAGDVAAIQQKMRDRVGLTLAEMEIAADLGWIRRDQFWHWTPESQAQMQQAEADLAAGRYETFESVDDLFAALDDDGHETPIV
jgi:hypothetical protein